MIADLKPYPEYEESGMTWLGPVPRHWHLMPAFGAFMPNRDRNRGMKEKTVLSLSYGRIIIKPAEKLHGLVPESFETYQIVNPGDIILRTTDLQNDHTSLRVGMVRDRGIITSAYLALKVSTEVSPDFGFQLLNVWDTSKAIYGYGSGLRQNLDFSHFKRMPVAVPPPDEQAAIVRFLDWANGRLERAIRAKRKVIALLNEQKQAIIHRAITRGLDPAVPLKPSGIPWLGNIPQHWVTLPLKRVVEVKDGTHDTPPYVEPSDASFPLVTSKDFGPSAICFDHAKHISSSHHKEVMKRSNTERGDILMSMIGGNIGKALIVDTDREFSIKNVALFKTCGDPILARFILYYLQSGLLDIHIALLSKGGAQGFLGLGQIRNLAFAKMPVSEMGDIVEALDLRLQFFDRLITTTRNSINLIMAYRTRLVADVVTGKLDVREAATRLPGEATEATTLDTPQNDADLSDENEPADEEAVV